MVAAGAALAQEPQWHPAVEPVGVGDYVFVGIGLGLIVGGNVMQPLSKQPAQQGAFDEQARAAVRLEANSSRYAIRDVSDFTLGLLMAAPLVGDALVNAAWYRKNPKVAWRMAIIDMEALAITGAVQGATSALVSRERPYGRDCGGALPTTSFDCRDQGRYRSFFSGHSSFSFTGAALICSHHLRLGLFGGGGKEVAACLVSFAVAAATATFRMMGDMHYATDVLVGAAFGTAVGFLVPALHEWAAGPDTSRAPPPVTLRIVPTGAGVSLMGAW